jgi:hypothetical protein
VQVKAYDSPPSLAGALRPRRLLVWEGRRKGCPGVGWGTGALIRDGVGSGIRERARKKAEEEAAEAAKPKKKPLAALAASAAAAIPAAASEPVGGKEAEPDDVVRGVWLDWCVG